MMSRYKSKRNMRIRARLEPNEKVKYVSFSLEEFGLTIAEWEGLTDKEKETYVNDAIISLPDTPYWVVDNFSETD